MFAKPVFDLLEQVLLVNARLCSQLHTSSSLLLALQNEKIRLIENDMASSKGKSGAQPSLYFNSPTCTAQYIKENTTTHVTKKRITQATFNLV
jgi:hypothetical protein